MPELPEIEIVKQSLYKNIKYKKIKKIIVKNRNLRFKLPSNFKNILKYKKIINIDSTDEKNLGSFNVYLKSKNKFR